MPSTDDHPEETVVVLNPVSGSGNHDDLRTRAKLLGFRVVETEGEGDAARLATEAYRDGADRIVAAGGDGTINEVVQALVEVDALDSVTFGVLPAGTGNNFAENIGIQGLDEAFEALQEGPVRSLDLGAADGRIFVNSCIGGLTAEASGETSPEMKSRYGVFAYVLETLRALADFEGVPISVRAHPTTTGVDEWTGDAVFVLIGNARRFPLEGPTGANAEDGLLNVTIIEERLPSDLLRDAAMERLFGQESDAVVRMQTPTLELSTPGESDVSFSFDGEMESLSETSVSVLREALPIHVGRHYEIASGMS